MTLWHKPAYVDMDRDRTTGALLPDAIPPGLYCEDEDAFRKLRAAARSGGKLVEGKLDGTWWLQGEQVRIATPEQARFFRAVAKDAPAPGAVPDPVERVLTPAERAARQMEIAVPAADAGPARRIVVNTPNEVAHRFRGANRQQRRAAEAKGRKRA